MGIFSMRINKEGAIVGMIVGLLFTVAYIAYFKLIAPGENTAEHWWFGISPEGIGTIGALLNFSVSALISRYQPPPPKHVQDLVEHIRIPKGVESPHAH
jgi:cation/acetate symporter